MQFGSFNFPSRPISMPQNPLESVDVDALLEEAILQLAKVKENAGRDVCCSGKENISLLESIVLKLNHIKERRVRDSDIIK
jgi:hypothetical protein